MVRHQYVSDERQSSDIPEHIIAELRSVIHHAARPTSTTTPRMQARHPLDVATPTTRQSEAFAVALVTAQRARAPWTLIPWFLGAGFVIVGLLFVSQYGVRVKERVVKEGSAAIGNLLSAKESLDVLDLATAQKSLTASAEQFSNASRELNAMGSTMVGLLSHVPGLSSLRTGHDLLTIGSLLSHAGLVMSEALDAAMKSGAILSSTSTGGQSMAELLGPLQKALAQSQADIQKASELIAGIDSSELPLQYQSQFRQLQDRLPAMKSLTERAAATIAFLKGALGVDHPQRYLVLFSNSSELRPTGGFPGSYGLLTFEAGRVKDFRADDIYNPDGQLKTLIVPPRELQHITPGWGMRDAAWWADFPTSARKVMEFWRHDGGAAVDGVLTIKPDVLQGVLEITGPLSLPDYDLVLTSKNVLATLQLEVESKKTPQPKKIIIDIAPLVLKRIADATPAQWLQLAELLMRSLRERDMLMYFEDPSLQDFARQQGVSGSVRETNGDYLQVVISNIKGAKADAVTDTSMKLEGWLDAGTMVHRLTLTRRHNGGQTDYGFYNKINNSYVRVLVPKGSVLRGIRGNANSPVKPLLSYTESNSVTDRDLATLESTYRTDDRGVTTYEESGKTGFGFWMSIPPGSTQAVQIEYEVPARVVSERYSLLVQRQPGLDLSDVEITLQKNERLRVTDSLPLMTAWPDSWRIHTNLKEDFELSATLKR